MACMRSTPPIPVPAARPKSRQMAKKWLIAILVLTFAFVLMPFLLWYMTTFTRPLSDADLGAYFADSIHPRRAQHALSQIADRMMSPNPAIRESAKPWYPEVIKFSRQGSDELRVTAAWVMGQDNTSAGISRGLAETARRRESHGAEKRRIVARALCRSLRPRHHRRNARALRHARARSGALAIRLKPGDVINPGTMVGHISVAGEKTEVRSASARARSSNGLHPTTPQSKRQTHAARRSQPGNGLGIPARPVL